MEIYPLRFFAPSVIEASASTRMVQAVTLHKYGKTERIKVEDTPLDRLIPEGCVEVEVHYCGLSFTDHYLRLGIIQNENFPAIMGSECCGVVTAVGEGVTSFQVGQRVLCLQLQGGLFRHVVHVLEQYCFAVPDDMSLKTAISLGLNFVLAYLCLVEFGCPERTKSIFMDSIGGSVGTAVIEIARKNPGVTILGTASESKHQKLLSIGVDKVYRHEDDYVNKVLEAFPGGVDLVINCAGGAHFDLDFKMLKPSGKLTTIGSNSSVIYPKTPTWGVFRPTWDNKLLTTAEMIKNNYTMVGINVGRLLQVHPERIRLVLNQIFQMYADGNITPHIHAIYPFEKAADGLAQLFERENVGKVLLSVDNRTDVWNKPIPVFGPAVTLPRYLGRPKSKDLKEEETDGEEEKTDAEEEIIDEEEERMGVEEEKQMAKVEKQMGKLEGEKHMEERDEEQHKRDDGKERDDRQEELKDDRQEEQTKREENRDERDEEREEGEEEQQIDQEQNVEKTKKKMEEAKEEEEAAAKKEEEEEEAKKKKKEEEAKKKMDEAKKKMDEAKKKMDEAKKKMEEAKKKMEEAKKKMEEAKKKMEEAKKKMEEAKRQMEESKKKMEEAKKKMEEAKKKMEEAKKKMEEAQKKMEEAQKKMDECKKQADESKKPAEWPNKQMVEAHRMMGDGNRIMVEANMMMVDANRMMAEANMVMVKAKQKTFEAKMEMAESNQEMVEAKDQMDDANKQMDEIAEQMAKAM